MTYQHYTPEFKAKIVLQVLQGEKEIGELAKENNINPNLIRKWRTTFLEKAATVRHDEVLFMNLRSSLSEESL